MNDLLSSSFPREHDENHRHVIEMTELTEGDNLVKFFEEIDSLKKELSELERLNQSLKNSHEQSKTLHNAKAIKDLRSRMDADVSLALNKAKFIKLRLEALDRSNQENRSVPGSGPGSSSDRTRTSLVNGLRKKLKESMDSFNNLREQISTEYRDTVRRRYYNVTGENPDDNTVDLLVSTGNQFNFNIYNHVSSLYEVISLVRSCIFSQQTNQL